MKVFEKVYDISALSAESGFSNKTIWSWIRRGLLKSTKFGGPIRFRHQIEERDWLKFVVECNKQEIK